MQYFNTAQMDRISLQTISKVVKKSFDNSLLTIDNSSAIYYDLDFIEGNIHTLKQIFPSSTIHTIAVKANPLIKILGMLNKFGVGVETASISELDIGHKLGFPSYKIVFDSPTKTWSELQYALKLGVHINADSLNELTRISELYSNIESQSNIGIRINPQVGSGTIKSTSVADKVSKFGVPIKKRGEIIEAYMKYKWLNSIHFHIGSQGISVTQLLEGWDEVYDLTKEINKGLENLGRQVKYFDIGGGFPVSYTTNDRPPTMKLYIKKASSLYPELFSDKYTLITEFGRYVSANTAFAISRVEYVKDEKSYKILSTHLGADFLLRKAYNPDDWHHDISVLDKYGNIKKGTDNVKYTIAGPLCFSNDIIGENLDLPPVNEGDFIVIHDVGAYTLSMWSRYNSRQVPKVVGYSGTDIDFIVLKEKESIDDLYNFWT